MISKTIDLKQIVSRLLPRNSNSRNALLVVVGDAITFTATFVTAMILARLLTLNDMATYRQVLSLGILAQTIVEFGLSSSIYRFWNLLDARGRSTYIKMQLALSMGLGALASLALAILAPFLAVWYHNPSLRIALLICCASPLVNIVPLTIRPVMICKGKPLMATLTTMFFSLGMVLAIILPFYLGAGLNNALIIWMIVNFIEVFLTFYILQHEFIPGTAWWDKLKFKETWDYLWPIQAGRLPGMISLYTDEIATSVLLSTDAFAIYITGARELPFIGKIGASVSSVLIPSLVTDAESGNVIEICRRWNRACEQSALFTYPIVGFCVWFSLPMVKFLYSARYTDSRIPFAIFAAITFIRVIEFASLAKAFGKTAIILKSSFASAMVMLVLFYPATIWFGGVGMAVIVFLSVFTAAGYYLWAYVKLLKVPLSAFFPWKRLLLMEIASIACAAIVGVLFEPVLNIAESTGLLITGVKLVILFVFDLILYLLFLVTARIIRVDKILSLIKKPKSV
jgi:O-antigen/teichoic acid export membrane protein